MNSSKQPADILSVSAEFLTQGRVTAFRSYGTGHINQTFLLTTDQNRQYILQKISSMMTSDVRGLMENIARVSRYLSKMESDPRSVLTLIPTRDGDIFLEAPSGNWRVYEYVDHTYCLQGPASVQDFYQCALAFGHFLQMMKDFPAEELKETLPDFHNTPVRYSAFHQALKEDRAGRAAGVEAEIRFLLEREQEAGRPQNMRVSGELPVRVTHNDTKLDNILFDEKTGKPLCIVDLDTVMPGLGLYDFGDAIRSGASTASEDEPDLSKVHFDLHKYEVFSDGFLTACPDLSDRERSLLPAGARTITIEQAVRFLTDYLNGDIYYPTRHPQHNLDRTRTQIRLVEEMESMLSFA